MLDDRSNRSQCCHRLATAATFRKELCCPGSMTRIWAPPTCYTLRHNTVRIMKGLFLVTSKCECRFSTFHITFLSTQKLLFSHSPFSRNRINALYVYFCSVFLSTHFATQYPHTCICVVQNLNG